MQQMLVRLVRRCTRPRRSEGFALQFIIVKLCIKEVEGLYIFYYVSDTRGNRVSVLTVLSRILSCAANFCTSSTIPRIRRGPSSERTSRAFPSKLGGRSNGRSSISKEVGKFSSCSFLCGIDEIPQKGKNGCKPGGGQVQLLDLLT